MGKQLLVHLKLFYFAELRILETFSLIMPTKQMMFFKLFKAVNKNYFYNSAEYSVFD